MEILFVIIIFILGVCFGSFVNMMEYRLAVGYGLIKVGRDKSRPYNKNRSFCDYCGRQLKWYENIPIVSWLIQRGQTRCCNKKLPLTYPFIELMMGFLFVLYGLGYINTDMDYEPLLKLTLGLIIIVFLVLSFVFDLKYMLLPDFSTVILSFFAVGLNLVSNNFGMDNIISAVVASGFLLILHLLTKGKGMGMGDVKLAIFIGLLLGWKLTIVAFYIAFIVGALVGVILLFRKLVKKNTAIPFGPFLIIGTVVCWLLGDYVLDLIKGWL